MSARMKNPADFLDGSMESVTALFKAIYSGGVDPKTLELVHLRVSQINRCSACVHVGVARGRRNGLSEDQLATVCAWRDAPFFSAEQRTAMDLAERLTLMASIPGEAVEEDLWERATTHFNEQQLSAVLMMIGLTNLFNRLNAPTRAQAGESWD